MTRSNYSKSPKSSLPNKPNHFSFNPFHNYYFLKKGRFFPKGKKPYKTYFKKLLFQK